MTDLRRQVEVFTAGCLVCEEAVALVRKLACPSCIVTVQDMHDDGIAARAKQLGIGRLPAVVIDGQLADCCRTAGVDEAMLKTSGLGQPTS